jgi:hypothetical protein
MKNIKWLSWKCNNSASRQSGVSDMKYSTQRRATDFTLLSFVCLLGALLNLVFFSTPVA